MSIQCPNHFNWFALRGGRRQRTRRRGTCIKHAPGDGEKVKIKEKSSRNKISPSARLNWLSAHCITCTAIPVPWIGVENERDDEDLERQVQRLPRWVFRTLIDQKIWSWEEFLSDRGPRRGAVDLWLSRYSIDRMPFFAAAFRGKETRLSDTPEYFFARDGLWFSVCKNPGLLPFYARSLAWLTLLSL